MELLQDLCAQELGPLFWEHEPARWEPFPDGGLRVFVPSEVDYFQDPRGSYTKDPAPFLWLPVKGDFVARTLVRPTFTTTYDAGALMVRHDETHWAKLCYESTDLDTRAAVSVVTNGLSDDANGVDLDVAAVWLQIVRQGDVFAMHYALDGSNWRMVRYFALPMPPQVQVGLVAQSPIGPGTRIDFVRFTVESRGVEDLRAGI